ncbi:hypothetical protein PUNSTDRAFT_145227 [Punctularia strigosozonata HHB-11173 SS5]|uniref:uncharacterized protein n=1 Tax=Punctularia strigosozonata (strain HHB-11173) TaxID=741275 RepID=UPI0004417B38|nr:uncharacterized protein PUNSTDRAFT_145227 [Punctularia strigosozonata HHB-11173 SS5]EIN06713.1 hypothetical protein PUNSTDRAFT_145227 [Punctularia strigosozonata HHB-11173 SS5]
MSATPHGCSIQSNTPDILTYRYQEQMVYVKPASQYDQAVADAVMAFPELSGLDRDRISFSLTVFVQNTTKTVTISPNAWPAVIATLSRFEILDVNVRRAIKDEPPVYAESADLLEAPGMKERSRSAPPPGRIQSWLGKRL